MKRLLLVVLLIALPLAAAAAGKTHMKTDSRDCSECHGNQEKIWLEGKHGLMNVKCVVCHGSPEENFTAKPGLARCRGCHGEQVADVKKKLPETNCFFCHDNHTVRLKSGAADRAGFHGQGGAK